MGLRHTRDDIHASRTPIHIKLKFKKYNTANIEPCFVWDLTLLVQVLDTDPSHMDL